ncbi:MAG: hypothetical protein K2J77_11790 [Oscillospiraceae bacterium]|nr:hypothetical protein [Oscillospiraceae bacterium]
MYDRYGDITKFITDPDKLTVSNGEVYISGERDYDIVVDVEDCYGNFNEVKPFIALISKHINELDNTVQRFNKRKRVRRNGYSEGRLPSHSSITRYDYSKSMEDEPDIQKREAKTFPFVIGVIYLPKPNFVMLDYWCTEYNSQFEVVFEYKDGGFFLRSFGAFDLIPDDWEAE